MLTTNYPSHLHLVPPGDGLLMFRGLALLRDYANDLYNQGLRNKDAAMCEMAAKLAADVTGCMHRQFDGYQVTHLSQSVFTKPVKSDK